MPSLQQDLPSPLVWEAIQKLEAAGFMMIAVTCDGASVNRKFFHMHGTGKLVHKTTNPYPTSFSIFLFGCPTFTKNCTELLGKFIFTLIYSCSVGKL